MRSLIAFRLKLKKQENAVWLRLRNNIFAQYFPELEVLYIQAGEPDDQVLSIAESCLNPREIARLEFANFLKLIVKGQAGGKAAIDWTLMKRREQFIPSCFLGNRYLPESRQSAR